MRHIDDCILHCSATRARWMADATPEQRRAEIRRWHVEERGWDDIGYHWLIDRGGELLNGRPETVAGAHVKGQNATSIGVCLIGGHGATAGDRFTDHFTLDQRIALIDLLNGVRRRLPGIRISGHNDYAPKGCPGFDVLNFVSNELAQ